MPANAASPSLPNEAAQERTQAMAERFIRCLRHCEREKDVEPLVKLFSERALIGNLMLQHPFHGREGARSFWNDYCHAFEEVHSHFTRVNGGGPVVALEWTSEGVVRSGKPITYRGVSLLEFEDNPRGEPQITRFQAYYDTSAMTEHAGAPAHARDVSSAA
jgi:hypothetical protein